MPFINYNDTKVYYELKKKNGEAGASIDALIFVHGSGESSLTWKNQFSLDLNLDLIAIDLPSHGKSELVENLDLDLYVDAIHELINQLKLKSVILCGHSLGGAIIQDFYFKHPEKVVGLILVGTGARLRVAPMILESLSKDFQAYLDSIPVGAFYRKTDQNIINEFVSEVSKVPESVVFQDFSICDKFDVIDEVKSGKIKVPSLIICGKADKLTPVKYSQFFKQNIDNSELIIIKNAGHMVMLENPSELNEVIKNFINTFN